MSVVYAEESLENYRALVHKVDELCSTVSTGFADHIHCRAGCSDCCREISLFPVEAAALLNALSALPPESAVSVAATAHGNCPLLADGLCLVYSDRPIICRTHGFPLLLQLDGKNRVDFCPENFRSLSSLPGQAIINLERLNHALVAINELFVQTAAGTALPHDCRLTVSALITLWKGLHNHGEY